jgi:hypothetical protein
LSTTYSAIMSLTSKQLSTLSERSIVAVGKRLANRERRLPCSLLQKWSLVSECIPGPF